MNLPKWFPEVAICVEMRPLLSFKTRIMWESYEMYTFEIIWADIEVWKWSWSIRLYKKGAK